MFASVYLAIIFQYQLTIFICSSQDQTFDDKIDYNCCVKNLLRFLSSNITGGRIDKRLNYLQAILFLGSDFFAMKSNTLFSLLFLFVDLLFLLFAQSKLKFSLRQFLIQTDISIHKIPPISFMYTIEVQKYTI